MKAIAVDDERIALDIVQAHAAKVPFIEIKAVFTDAFQALDYLQKEPIDLIFLDIKMPDISGIDFFHSLSRKPFVIFTTAYTEHAVAGFELDAIDYLLKPFSLARFIKGCNKAYELFNYRNSNQPELSESLYVKTGHEQVRVELHEILYLEAAGNYVTFVTPSKSLLSRSTFAEAIALLPANRFVRIHRSFVVAVNKIDKLEKTQVTIGNKIIPVSEAYAQELFSLIGR
ncbi:MAG: response regulator transcription factor [Williamsia sp.]|nr:response regulator transcription factor [Williamsia sp.]